MTCKKCNELMHDLKKAKEEIAELTVGDEGITEYHQQELDKKDTRIAELEKENKQWKDKYRERGSEWREYHEGILKQKHLSQCPKCGKYFADTDDASIHAKQYGHYGDYNIRPKEMDLLLRDIIEKHRLEAKKEVFKDLDRFAMGYYAYEDVKKKHLASEEKGGKR